MLVSPAEPEEDAPAAGAALIDAATAAERHRAAALAAAVRDGPGAWGGNEELRARTALLIDGALVAIEAALRVAEPALDAAPPCDLFDRVVASGLIGRSGLAATALARAEEHRLVQALEQGLGAERSAIPADGIDDADPAAAFAVHAAEAARIDRIGEPLLPLNELTPEDRHALLWQVAALLAEGSLAAQGPARSGNEEATHRAAAAAVACSLGAIDDAEAIGAVAVRRARALAEAGGGIDDTTLAATLADGRVARLAALLAVRAGVGFEDARAMLLSPDRAAVLLRACDVGRETASALLLTLLLALEPDGGTRFAALVAGFDGLAPDIARAHVRFSRYDPQYREALALIGIRE